MTLFLWRDAVVVQLSHSMKATKKQNVLEWATFSLWYIALVVGAQMTMRL
jgi:hypothetical protein